MSGTGIIKRSIDRDDVYSKMLLKMLPTEMVGVCLAVIGTIFSFTEQGGLQTGLLWTVFAVGLVATPFWLIYGMEVRKPLQVVITTVAFVIWMMTMRGPFTTIPGYQLVIGSVALMLFSGLIAPLVGMIVRNQERS